jgi:hypothetical protein
MNEFTVLVKQGRLSRYWRVWLVPTDAPAARVCIGAAWTKGKAVERAYTMLSLAQHALATAVTIEPPKPGPFLALTEEGV